MARQYFFYSDLTGCLRSVKSYKEPLKALEEFSCGDAGSLIFCFGVNVTKNAKEYVGCIEATSLLRKFARDCALDVIHWWDAPPIVKEYLETGNEAIRGAARDAAWDVARDAAWDAALAAAWDAGRAAAWDAGRAAGLAAALAAARDAGRAAARAAARAAGWAAGRAAAWDVARDAAWDAAWDAARDAQNKRLERMLLEAFYSWRRRCNA